MRLRHLFVIASLGLAPVSASAQTEDGSEMMRKGLELFLEGLQDELSPALREFADLAAEAGPALRAFLEEMGPAFAEVLKEVQDWSAYHPPEILPNGDIIIRRKPREDMPDPDAPDAPGTEGPVDL